MKEVSSLVSRLSPAPFSWPHTSPLNHQRSGGRSGTNSTPSNCKVDSIMIGWTIPASCFTTLSLVPASVAHPANMANSSSYTIRCPARENRLSVLNLPKHDRHVHTYIHYRENRSLTQTNNTLGITVWTHYMCMSGLLLTSKGCRSTQSNWKHQLWNCPWFNKFFCLPWSQFLWNLHLTFHLV